MANGGRLHLCKNCENLKEMMTVCVGAALARLYELQLSEMGTHREG